MAFGGLKGTLTFGATSITNPANATGSVVVAVGDLVVAVIAELTALTATATTDNLGNTYTAQNAGTLSTVSGRCFWSRVTVAGTLTTVNVACTASADDGAVAVAVFEGPFAASPVDANPANATADITSPYTAPLSGTLTQLVELVVGWIAGTRAQTMAVNAPFSFALNALSAAAGTVNSAGAAIAYQLVASTVSTSANFTGTAPTADVLGTISFKGIFPVGSSLQMALGDQYYDSSGNTYWLGRPNGLEILSMLTAGGKPLTRFSTHSQYPDASTNLWQGAPVGSNTIKVPVPKAPITRAPMFVPKPVPQPDYFPVPIGAPFGLMFMQQKAAQKLFHENYNQVPDPNWVGSPTANPPLWQLAQPFSKPLRLDYGLVPDPPWYSTPTDNPLLWQLARPFAKLWSQYTIVPHPDWVGTPLQSVTLAITPVMKPSGLFRWYYNYQIETPWQGTPIGVFPSILPVPPGKAVTRAPMYVPRGDGDRYWQGAPIPVNMQTFPVAAQPIAKLWRYDLITDTFWTWSPPGSNTLNTLVEGGKPFSNEWSALYTVVPSPDWLGTPLNSYALIIPKPQPFSKQWRYDYTPEPFWLGTPTANPVPWQLAATFSKLWRYDYNSGETWWSWAPPGSNTLNTLVEGGAPTFKQWRYDLEPDKYWQGSPTQTNIRFFPFVAPFNKLWRYDLITDTWWQGAPSSNPIPQRFAQPFSKLWRYDWDSDARQWNWPPQSAETLQNLTVGGQPFSKLWRYDFEPDKLWQGAPSPTNLRFFPFIAPFSRLWRYDLITDTWWQGSPTPSNIGILPPPPVPFAKQWRYDLEPDKLWQRYSWPANALEMLVEGGRPFSKQWRYDLEFDKLWQGSPLPSNVGILPPPFVQTAILRPLLYVPRPEWDKVWQGSPTPTNVQTLPAAPFPNKWYSQYTYDPDTRLWQRYSWPAVTQNILVEGGKPTFKQWRYDFEPDKYWQGVPIQTNIRFFPFVAPFSKLWRYDFEADKYWQGSPLNARSAYIPFQQPPVNEWYGQYTYDSDTKLWQRYSWPAISLNMLVEGGRPTFKLWRYDYEADKYWQGAPIQTNVRFFPFVAPFSNEWSSQTTYVHEYYWKGSPISSYIPALPQVNPFFKQARFDYDSGQTYWAGTPTPAATLIVLSQPKMFGQPGQGPTKQWHYDADFNTYWQGSPSALSPVFITQFFGAPFQAPTKQWRWDYNQEFYWIAHITLNLPIERPPPVRPPNYAVGTFHRDDIIWWPTRQPNIALITSLLPQMTPATFKWEHPPIETRWLGTPLSYPTPYMRARLAIMDPNDLIPSHVLHPQRKVPLTWLGDDIRKDPIPDEPRWPRRKDPIK